MGITILTIWEKFCHPVLHSLIKLVVETKIFIDLCSKKSE